MFTKVIVLAFVAVAVAVPMSQESQDDTCTSKGGMVYCCDSQTAKELTQNTSLLSSIDLQNFLGQCNEVVTPSGGADVPVKSQCSQQSICCGEIGQDGLANNSCTPLDSL